METLKLFVLIVLCIPLICLKNNPDAALGDDCSTDVSVCNTTINGMCNGTNCVCEETHYDSGGICTLKKGYGANCSGSNECGVPAGGNNQCVDVSGLFKCVCTEGKYWDGSQCQDVSMIVPDLTLSNPTLSTIDVSWTTPAADQYNSVYKLTWKLGDTTVSSEDIGTGNTFTIQDLTPGTEYTVSIERQITEQTHLRMQSVSGGIKKETTKKGYGAACSESNECGVPSGGNKQCVAVSGVSKCLCTEGKYWNGSQCQDVSTIAPVLMLSNSTLSTIDASWTTPAAAEYNSVYKLTWTTGGNTVGSKDIVAGNTFKIQGLTLGTEYTVFIERRITEKTYLRMQSVSGGNKKETTKKTFSGPCSRNEECGFSHSECRDTICRCVTVKYWTGLQCDDRIAYGNGCSKNGSCMGDNIDCFEGRCWCNSGFFRTSSCLPNVNLTPTNVTTQRISTTELRVSWSAPSLSSVVDGYEVDIVPAIQNNQKVVTGTTATLTSLTPGERYSITVKTRSNYRNRGETVAAAVTSEVTVPAATKGLTATETFMEPTINISFYKAEGRTDFYKVRLQRGQPDSYDDETVVINADNPTSSFFNVKAGLDYNLTIISNSHGVMSAPFKEQIPVQAEASEAVVGLAPADITSRSASVSWRRPHNTKGALYLYSLQIWNASTCVQEILVNCTDCIVNAVATFHSDCGSRNKTNISSTNLNDENYLLEFNLSLFPDTGYSVHVVAYNKVGKGKIATTPLQTLAEVPGDPTDFRYVSKTSNSIHLMWTPPMPRPGVTAYNITVYERQEEVDQYTFFNVIEQIGFYNTSINITGLSSYWKYSFQNSAKTGKGQSGSVNISEVITDESAPTKVVNLQSRKIPGVFNQIGLSWSCPQQKDGRNGIIQTSTVRYSTDTPNADVNPMKDTKTLTNKGCSWNVTVEVTAEFNYTFEVFISNSIDGQPSVIHEYMEAGPAAITQESTPKERQEKLSSGQTTIPLAVCPKCILDAKNGRVTSSGVIVCTTSCTKTRRKRQLKMQDDFANLSTWKQAKEQGFTTEYKASPDNWLANVKGDSDIVYKVGNDTSCDGKPSDIYCNGPLNEGTTYAIRVFACTLAGCDESEEIQIETINPPTNVALIAGCVVGGVVAAALVIVLVFVFRYMRKRPTTIKRKLDEASDEEELIIRKRPIRIKDFEKRVEIMHKDSNLLFSEEFEDISTLSPKHMCIASETGGNKLKNRYVNILPFDHTRVKLRHAEEDDEETDYINANYIPGYSSPREYIATQGPMTGTVNDFWRMIWEQNVPIIVMLSDLMENGKPKVDRYYPENMDPVQYGDIVLEMTNFSPLNKYVIRIFKLKVGDEVRQVRHYFLPGWKDFGANLNSDDVIDFVKDVRMEIKPNKLGPICVHCSAGVGRTGTYISLDVFQQHINEENMEKELDIFDFVMTMRQNRSYMVQTEKQYIFIHDTIKEMIIKKKKEIAERDNIYENSTNDGIYINQAFETDPQDIYMNVDNDTTKPTTVL